MTKRSQNGLQREEMTPFEKRATVTIFSSLKDTEKGRKIYLSLKAKGLTIDYLSISDNSFSLYIADRTTKDVLSPEGYCRLMINNIISDLMRRRIKSETEYDFRKFDERYLKGLKKLLSQEATTTSLQEESTTEGVEHETQEDSEHFTVESAHLKQQEPDLAPDETTEEIKYVTEEIKRSNASNGITTENIEYVQDMTRDVTFTSDKVTSRNVPAFPELSSTNGTLPQLPNESWIICTTVAGLSTLSAYIIAPVVLLAAVTLCVCWFLHKKKREDSCNVEKAGVENELEAPFFKEQNSPLLDEANVEQGTY